MKKFLGWTAAIVGMTVAGTFAVRAVQSGRRRVKAALGEAEAVADKTRAALEQTETTLHKVRTSM